MPSVAGQIAITITAAIPETPTRSRGTQACIYRGLGRSREAMLTASLRINPTGTAAKVTISRS
jgi:hypothetical protein